MENLLALDDASLLERYLVDGDESAITVLYLRYQGPLVRYGQRHLQDAADAGDLVQSTWESLLTWRGLGSSKAPFKATLFHIAHNLVRQWWQYRDRWRAARAAFEAAGGQLQSAACRISNCTRTPRDGKDLCPAHEQRLARGATEEEMLRPVRKWRKKC